MSNNTERYMIIFNDIGLTIKGYYNEPIAVIQRKKILDRLYSLIHRELFEGIQPLEEQLATGAQMTQVAGLPLSDTTTFPPEPKIKRPYKHKAKYLKKKNKREHTPMIEHPVTEPSNMEMSGIVTTTVEPKDSVYDNEDDNQYGEFKKKGLI